MKIQFRCMDKQCGTIMQHTHPLDGVRCKKCDGPVFTEPYNPNDIHVRYERPLAKYKCLCCEHSEQLYGSKKDYSEVKVCPKCNGAFVDIWVINKYKKQKNIPLMKIELPDIDSVPIVYYNGEEISKKIRVSFDYGTETDSFSNSTFIRIEHADPDSDRGNIKIIQHNHPIVE